MADISTVEMVLRSTIPMLNSMHVLGSEAGTMEAVKNNIKMAIAAIDKAKEEAKHADHNEQGKNV